MSYLHNLKDPNFKWADEVDNDDTDNIKCMKSLNAGYDNFEKIDEKMKIKDIHKDVNEEFQKLETIYEKEKEKEKLVKNIEMKIEKIKDEPADLLNKVIELQNKNLKDIKSIFPPKEKEKIKERPHDYTWKMVNKKKKKGKCYTCNPRRKVSEHIIQVIDDVTFHHDMCNRNIIVATHKKHFESFENIDIDIIGTIFKAIHKFCVFWSLKDYSVMYNQGSWKNHDHFHIKIKTHENVIKRMRGDHWERIKLEKIYNGMSGTKSIEK